VRLDRITCAAALLTFMLTVGSASCGADALPDVAGAATVAVPGVGVSLSGYLVKPERRTRSVPAVLLLHDAGGNAEDLVDTARVLAEQGYMGLALSMRGFRGSEGQDDCGEHHAHPFPARVVLQPCQAGEPGRLHARSDTRSPSKPVGRNTSTRINTRKANTSW